MRDAPWFAFYVKDWIVETALLTAAQKGALADLRAYAWHSDPPCTLPNDDTVLAKLSGLARQWPKLGVAVRAFFIVEDDKLRDPMLSEAYEEMVKSSARKSQAGKLGAEQRWKGHSKVAGGQERVGPMATAPSETHGNRTTDGWHPQSDRESQTDTQAQPEPPSGGNDCSHDVTSVWPGRMQGIWRNQYGGDLPAQKVTALSNLVVEHGPDEVARRLENYCLSVEGRYATVQRFAETFGEWTTVHRRSEARHDGDLLPGPYTAGVS
jgi:uncharacterized protein YdaU (DUF1376 family)